jgi:hypothetical protein
MYNKDYPFPKEYTRCPRYVKLEFEGIEEIIHYCTSTGKECYTVLCSMFSPTWEKVKVDLNGFDKRS